MTTNSRPAAQGYALFATELGQCGVAWGAGGIVQIALPERDEAALEARLQAGGRTPERPPPAIRRAIRAIQQHLAGKVESLAEVELDMTGLPPFTRLALSQTLRRLPQVAGSPTVGGVQRFPEGGYEGLARSGSLDSLHPTELAYPEPLFLHRVLNREALYYGRESPRQRRRELAYVILQTGWGLGGDGQIMARALLLALAQTLRRRGYEVVYSFAGRSLSEPGPLTSPAHVARVLHHQEAARTDEEAALNSVHGHLRTWHETYPGRQVLWIIGEHFDADHYDQHSPLYAALHAEAGQQAWFIHVGPAATAIRPPAADLFRTWQVMSTETIWEDAATEH